MFSTEFEESAVQVKENIFFQTRPIDIFFHLVFPFGLSHSDHLDFIWNSFSNSFFQKVGIALPSAYSFVVAIYNPNT